MEHRFVNCVETSSLASFRQRMADGITLGIALVGATLGILNTWRAFDRDRIRLRVTPRRYLCRATGGGDTWGWCVEVINIGYLPVTLSDVSFALRGDEQFMFGAMRFDQGEQLPIRLEARTSVIAYLGPGFFAVFGGMGRDGG